MKLEQDIIIKIVGGLIGIAFLIGIAKAIEKTPSDIPPSIPPVCIPNWQCDQPLNGYELDGCGSRRPNTVCSAIIIPPLPPLPTTTCYRKVQIYNTLCPWAWGQNPALNYWVEVIPVGQTWTYKNCYATLDATKIAIDNLYNSGYSFNQC